MDDASITGRKLAGGGEARIMISVIIPAFNEEKALPQTLQALFAQPGDYEVIVVDGGSTDRTVEIAAAWPDIRLVTAAKGCASQMNAGAIIAGGEWLLFLHADTLLPDDALRRIEELDARPVVQAGGFRHRFSGDDWRLRLISWLDNIRCQRTRVIYGDQAIFVRRTLFQEIGGFPRQPVLEDVALCEKLVRNTRPLILKETVTTDARKFVQEGVWLSLLRVVVIVIRCELGLPVPSGYAFFKDVR